MSTTQELEQQLDSLWEQSRTRKARKIEDLSGNIQKQVDEALQEIRQKVRAALARGEKPLQARLDDVRSMERDFASGIELWHKRSGAAIQDLQKEHMELQRMVSAATDRLVKQKEVLLSTQQRRLEALGQQCSAVIQRCKEQIDATNCPSACA